MDEAKITLGKTDLQIAPMGIGAWSWGDSLIWQFGKGYGEDDVCRAIETSIAGGIDFFDTAEVYGFGRSEKFLARFLRAPRALIATKCFPFPWRVSARRLLPALRGSLKRLGLARVDLYQMHWPFPPVAIESWMRAMADARDAGLLRAVGVSNYSAEQTRRAHRELALRNIPLASNQVKYSLLSRAIEFNGVMDACRELGVTIIAYSPIEMGLLAGKYTPENPPPGLRAQRYSRDWLARIQPLIATLREIGNARGKTPAQVALNWTMCKNTVPIPGAKNARQAQENIGALGWRLTADDVALLDEISTRVKNDATH